MQLLSKHIHKINIIKSTHIKCKKYIHNKKENNIKKNNVKKQYSSKKGNNIHRKEIWDKFNFK